MEQTKDRRGEKKSEDHYLAARKKCTNKKKYTNVGLQIVARQYV